MAYSIDLTTRLDSRFHLGKIIVDWYLIAFGTLGLASAWALMIPARRILAETTLLSAWYWMAGALVIWTLAWCISMPLDLVNEGIVDMTWYFAASSMLCPWIAVLGAKRPGSRVWGWFILFPLLIVLMWPAMASASATLRGAALEMESPALAGFVLVLLMGAGNYLGTKFWLGSSLLAVSVLVVVVGTLSLFHFEFSNEQELRACATMTLGISFVRVRTSALRKRETDKTFDTIWRDFRDWFGIVWARRIQDRINKTAESESWSCRLAYSGFEKFDAIPNVALTTETRVAQDEPLESKSVSTVAVDQADRPAKLPPSPDDLPEPKKNVPEKERIEQTMRWLLRRFVDPSWIDSRLGSA